MPGGSAAIGQPDLSRELRDRCDRSEAPIVNTLIEATATATGNGEGTKRDEKREQDRVRANDQLMRPQSGNG